MANETCVRKGRDKQKRFVNLTKNVYTTNIMLLSSFFISFSRRITVCCVSVYIVWLYEWVYFLKISSAFRFRCRFSVDHFDFDHDRGDQVALMVSRENRFNSMKENQSNEKIYNNATTCPNRRHLHSKCTRNLIKTSNMKWGQKLMKYFETNKSKVHNFFKHFELFAVSLSLIVRLENVNT